MLSVAEALREIARHCRPLPAVRVPLERALGRVLAEDVAADIDSPPHDKALVDGYAVRAADFDRAARGESLDPVEMAVIEEIAAGMVPGVRVTGGHAARIMTGAPLPVGADAVVMVEQTSHAEEPTLPLGVVTFHTDRVRPGQNIMPRAASIRRGQRVLAAGSPIRPIEIGLLAEVGRAAVSVTPAARVAVLPTGNELLPPEMVPAAGQIRNSNGPMLLAAVKSAGCEPIELGIARDDREDLRQKISRGLEHDVLLLSGGVSAGILDLVPEVLEQLGVERVFHKVRVKPGKPLWFGRYHSATGTDCLVFGLPGNPVSGLVCHELFVRPALARLAGLSWSAPRMVPALLTEDHTHRGDRPVYHPARLEDPSPGDRPPQVGLLSWKGSGDLHTLATANCLALFEVSERRYTAGESISVLPLP